MFYILYVKTILKLFHNPFSINLQLLKAHPLEMTLNGLSAVCGALTHTDILGVVLRRLRTVRMRFTYRTRLADLTHFYWNDPRARVRRLQQWSASASALCVHCSRYCTVNLHFYVPLVFFPPLCHKQSSCCFYQILFNCLLR